MKQFFVTYGCGSDKAQCYSLIDAPDAGDAYRQAAEACGTAFAFVYPVEGNRGSEDGLAAQKRHYHLVETPLGPQRSLA
jgi:hypothetical protein